jgi:hypothetical protein
MADNAAEKQRRRRPGSPFQLGRFGNPAGKRKGSHHRVTLIAEERMVDDTVVVVRAAVERAFACEAASAPAPPGR